MVTTRGWCAHRRRESIENKAARLVDCSPGNACCGGKIEGCRGVAEHSDRFVAVAAVALSAAAQAQDDLVVYAAACEHWTAAAQPADPAAVHRFGVGARRQRSDLDRRLVRWNRRAGQHCVGPGCVRGRRRGLVGHECAALGFGAAHTRPGHELSQGAHRR